MIIYKNYDRFNKRYFMSRPVDYDITIDTKNKSEMVIGVKSKGFDDIVPNENYNVNCFPLEEGKTYEEGKTPWVYPDGELYIPEYKDFKLSNIKSYITGYDLMVYAFEMEYGYSGNKLELLNYYNNNDMYLEQLKKFIKPALLFIPSRNVVSTDDCILLINQTSGCNINTTSRDIEILDWPDERDIFSYIRDSVGVYAPDYVEKNSTASLYISVDEQNVLHLDDVTVKMLCTSGSLEQKEFTIDSGEVVENKLTVPDLESGSTITVDYMIGISSNRGSSKIITVA